MNYHCFIIQAQCTVQYITKESYKLSIFHRNALVKYLVIVLKIWRNYSIVNQNTMFKSSLKSIKCAS